MRKYGLPYQGSKNKIADKIMEYIPDAENFYDLFAGGCAMSHCALLSNKFKSVHANDITDIVILFKDAIEGNLDKYEPERFRSKQEFFDEKDDNPFVRICYSFSNDQKTYLYSKELEPYKKALHELIYADTPHERLLKFKKVFRALMESGIISTSTPPTMSKCRKSGGDKKIRQYTEVYNIERIFRVGNIFQVYIQDETSERCYRMKDMQKYQRIENIERSINVCHNNNALPELSVSVGDYRDVDTKPNSVIYCDIPYYATKEYQNLSNKFDYDAFYNWCEMQTNLVIVSSYWMPDERFICIAEIERLSTFSASNNSMKRIEKLFVPKHQYGLYKTMMSLSKRNNQQLNLFNQDENND